MTLTPSQEIDKFIMELTDWRGKWIKQFRLIVFPIRLGSGKKVFSDGLHTGLKLIETKPFPSGVVLMSYQPDGK